MFRVEVNHTDGAEVFHDAVDLMLVTLNGQSGDLTKCFAIGLERLRILVDGDISARLLLFEFFLVRD